MRAAVLTVSAELARGEGEGRTWNNTWHVSLRRCGPWGATSWTTPAYGHLADGTGYYDQDVWLGDGWVARMLLVRYRWRFDLDGVRLYALVASLCGECPSPLGAPYVKEPKVIVTLNGRAGSEPFRHFSTFSSSGESLGAAASSRHERECSYAGRNPREGTGHCFDGSRERVRWDYLDSASGGCSVERPCFHAVFRSYPVRGTRLALGSRPGPWESRSGLEGWALDAGDAPAAGAAACKTIEGEVVSSPAQENARNWEYAGNKTSPEAGYDNSMVMAKGWDGCTSSLDATALYRRLERGSYGFFVSLSLGSGWARR